MRTVSAGISLIELLVVVAIIGILTAAVTSAYMSGVSFERRLAEGRGVTEDIMRFEDRVTNILRRAYLTPTQTDTDSYFIGEQAGNSGGEGSDTLIFTGTSGRLRGSIVTSTSDFETLNEDHGPQGGLAEYALSTVPVGEAPVQEGLFLREQRPPDSEPTMGGMETLIEERVEWISFEFFDGETWQTVWDTTQGTVRRLPAAVRVTYKLRDEDDSRLLVVRLPHSDVTVENPALPEGETG